MSLSIEATKTLPGPTAIRSLVMVDSHKKFTLQAIQITPQDEDRFQHYGGRTVFVEHDRRIMGVY